MTDITNMIGHAPRESRSTLWPMNTESEERLLRFLDVLDSPLRIQPRDYYCCVYFIRSGEFVKIGVARSVQRRLASLQTASPLPLEMLGILKFVSDSDAYRAERRLHLCFHSDRSNGEWFRYSDDIQRFVSTETESA